MNIIQNLNSLASRQEIGGKAWTLAQLYQEKYLIPDGFIVTPLAFWQSITLEQKEQLTKGNFSSLAEINLAESVQELLNLTLAKLCPKNALIAVRSSAIEEDNSQYSFAGQFNSYLNILPSQVSEYIIKVWQSAFTPSIISYRQQHQLFNDIQPPAVLIQKMVVGEISGVAFAADPVTGRQGITVISAVRGLAQQLVNGDSDSDHYYLDRNSELIDQKYYQEKPVLNITQIQEINQLVHQISRHFQRPQDVEWTIKDQQLYLLQSRPITTLKNQADPDGFLNLWDNSNIAESYSGVTTPLTFSFARRAYEEVYRQFCYLMGVPESTVSRHQGTFSRMIGLIKGRIYYNLFSWYQVLALLPGYQINRHFLEQMLGVKQSLSDTFANQFEGATWQSKLQDIWSLVNTSFGLVKNYLLLPKLIKNYYQRVDRALTSEVELEKLRVDELAAYYRKIEGQLLTRWDAPIVNDFFAMIFYGILRRLGEKWCEDQMGTLQNQLISQQGGIISTEPAQRMEEMAQLIVNKPEWIELLCQNSLRNILTELENFPELKKLYQSYLEKFSDRCLDELKLESLTLKDNPLPLLRSIGYLAQNQQVSKESKSVQSLTPNLDIYFKHHPIRKLIFNYVLKNTILRVRQRENLRFERTRVFGRARQVFRAIGQKFYSLDLLENPEDIFYLEVLEILSFIEGTSTCTNLESLVKLRQAEFKQYQQEIPPDDRFETRGIVYQGNSYLSEQKLPEIDASFLQGIGCSPGIVQGKVKIVTDPQQVLNEQQTPDLNIDTILVAQRTDPGWIILFTAVKGILVERGSLLSHVAIVTRELGIPAIVSIPNLTQWLQDGDIIEMDGTTGKIYKK
jgi:pyruvate,water dikinase